MSLALSYRFAKRELRSESHGFRIFLACLILGVTAIASIGTVRLSLKDSITQEGAALLGGDASLSYTYRTATSEERAWIKAASQASSEVIDFRSMAIAQDSRVITKVRAVDNLYPLVGRLDLSPQIPIEQALSDYGIIVENTLAQQLGVSVGDQITLGQQPFTLRALINRYPDNSTAGFELGARSIVLSSDLAASGLLNSGSLFTARYRLDLLDGTNLDTLKQEAQDAFPDSGHRWRDRRNSARNLSTFIDRLGAFLTLLALSSLAVGGIGIYAAVQSYIRRKTPTIAIFKTIGATRNTIILTYTLQIGALTLIGLTAGLTLGAILPLTLTPLITAYSPIPITLSPSLTPLIEASLYGLLTTALFTLWPIAKTENIKAAALFRGQSAALSELPRLRYILMSGGLFIALVGTAVYFSNSATLTLWTFGGVIGAILMLLLASHILRRIARVLQRKSKGHPMRRWALSTISAPQSDRTVVTLSIGLGLSILSIIGQIDSTLKRSFTTDLPQIAPSYFFIDIQPQQITPYQDFLAQDPEVTQVDTAPMLRAKITKINGKAPSAQANEHWVLRGDRGISYAGAQPKSATLTQGTWWPKDYNGAPQISFSQEEANELGLSLGDRLELNVLGRPIEATITSFRDVDFSDASIDFVVILNESALKGAPHAWISTVYTSKDHENTLLTAVSSAFPNLTAIHIRAVVEQVTRVANGLSQATTYAALMTLLTGLLVLIGTSAASHSNRIYDSAIFKTLGATRRDILIGLATRSALLGLGAALIALSCGIFGGWAIATFALKTSFIPNWSNIAVIIMTGLILSLLTESLFAWKTLNVKAASPLRSSD